MHGWPPYGLRGNLFVTCTLAASGVAAQSPAMIRELGYDKAEWVASQPVNLSELLKVASRAPQYFNLQRVNGSSVQHIAGGTSNWHWDCFVGRLLPAVARIMPEAIGPLYLLVNSYDEPVSRLETTCDARILDAHANIFGWPDRVTADEADRLPVFSPCKVRGCHRDWLYPYGEICDAESVRLTREIPWEDRKAALFWRGTTTGWGAARRAILQKGKNHRVRLVRALRQAAAQRNLSVDLGFTDFIQNIPRLEELSAPYVDFHSWNEYKYILDMGGNSYSRRLANLAHLKSALVLNNPYQDLFSRTLVNGTHVLWSDPTGDDILALYEMLVTESRAGQRMGTTLERHMRRHFNFESLVQHMASVLEAYAKVVKVVDDT